MATIDDKIKKAKEAGYSDEEIAKFLGTKTTKKGAVSSIPVVGDILNTILPQTTKQYDRALEPFVDPNKFKNNPQAVQQGMKDIEANKLKSGAEMAQYIPVTGNSFLTSLLTGGLRGASHGLAQDNATPQSVATSAAVTAPIEGGAYLLGKVLPYLTKKGVINKTNEAVKTATEKGKGMTFSDLSEAAKEKVKQKLGWTQEVRDAFNSTITEKTPASIEPGAGNFDPQQMLDWRRQIQARQGSGIFKFLQKGGDMQGKVDSIIRSTVSENLHKLAPESIKPDKLYSLYSSGGKLIEGDVPTKLLKVAAATVAWNKLPYILRNMLGAGIGEVK